LTPFPVESWLEDVEPGGSGVLNVEDWAEIRRLHRAEQMPIKAIARVMGISKNTVKRALASQAPPRYVRAPQGSIVDGVEPRIRELLQAWPQMPATVIAERIGWQHSLTVLKERVRELRPAYLPPDPASRTAYVAGEVAQFDLWFPPVEVPVGWGQTRTPTQLPVLVGVTGYARWLSALLLPTRGTEDLLAGWWQLLDGLGAIPRVLVWDGEGAVGRWRRGRSELTEACQAFRGVLGAKVVICRPADPEAKGLVERANGFLETSFLPGRTFSSPQDFNAQLAQWTALVNQRPRRVLGCAPADRIGADRAGMLPLPPVAPQTGWRWSARLPRDYYLRLDSNDYSVHPGVIGRRVELVADLQRVQVHCEGLLVADHQRCWARHQTLTDPAHQDAAQRLRHQRLQVTRRQPVQLELQVQQRPLADYDQAFGLDDGQGVA
jgi:transposase